MFGMTSGCIHMCNARWQTRPLLLHLHMPLTVKSRIWLECNNVFSYTYLEILFLQEMFDPSQRALQVTPLNIWILNSTTNSRRCLENTCKIALFDACDDVSWNSINNCMPEHMCKVLAISLHVLFMCTAHSWLCRSRPLGGLGVVSFCCNAWMALVMGCSQMS